MTRDERRATNNELLIKNNLGRGGNNELLMEMSLKGDR